LSVRAMYLKTEELTEDRSVRSRSCFGAETFRSVREPTEPAEETGE